MYVYMIFELYLHNDYIIFEIYIIECHLSGSIESYIGKFYLISLSFRNSSIYLLRIY